MMTNPVLRPVPVAGLVADRAIGPARPAVPPRHGVAAGTAVARLRRASMDVTDDTWRRPIGVSGRPRRSLSPATGEVRRFFPPPTWAGSGFDAHVTKTGGKAPHQPVVKQGWSVDKEKAPVTEIHNNGGQTNGEKTTRLTALLTPGHAKMRAGNPTAQGYDPMGWPWIVANEVRSANRNRITHWVRFHLLNATLGGKGRNIFHLIPADQSANSKWRTQIEAEMKLWVDKVPVWYDVQVTYYTQPEAPGTYAAAGANAIDYRRNIELFPKIIHAQWKIFDGRLGWVDMPSCTVRSGFPAAPGQRERELIGAQDLSALAAVYQIDADILFELAKAGRPFTAYAQVRRQLEDWAAASTTASQYGARMDRIASSEPYLRSALTGTGNNKLKIRGAFVPDDQTPEAKFYLSPAQVKTGQDFHRFTGVTPAIRSGYHHARDQAGGIPRATEFFHHYMRSGPIGNVNLGQLQTEWDAFAAANAALPPLVHTDVLPEGREILTLVVAEFSRTVPAALHTKYVKLVGACRAVDSLRDQVAARIPQFVEQNLGTLHFTVYGSDTDSMRVVEADPSVTGWVQEMEHRVRWHKHLLNKGLLARSPHDFLGAAITDKQPVRDAEAWYQQVKQQQQTPTAPVTVIGQPSMQSGQAAPSGGFGGPPQFGNPHSLQPGGQTSMAVDQELPDEPARKSGGGRYGSHTERTGQGGHGRYPWGSNIDPRNREVIRRIESRCERDPSIDQKRVDEVLATWRKPDYVGRGDTHVDVEKAMEYILKR